jgi:formaldehyde-activating enzyme involved in methanogenesis
MRWSGPVAMIVVARIAMRASHSECRKLYQRRPAALRTAIASSRDNCASHQGLQRKKMATRRPPF